MSIWTLYIVVMIAAVVVIIWSIGKRKRLKKYTEISLGMSDVTGKYFSIKFGR